jgi:hypothetical protein
MMHVGNMKTINYFSHMHRSVYILSNTVTAVVTGVCAVGCTTKNSGFSQRWQNFLTGFWSHSACCSNGNGAFSREVQKSGRKTIWYLICAELNLSPVSSTLV